jgi:DNA-binding response OmpR family regulator
MTRMTCPFKFVIEIAGTYTSTRRLDALICREYRRSRQRPKHHAMATARRAVRVVEDEPSLQQTLAAFLTLRGFRPFRAQNVEEALTILGREEIDAITMDVRMPDPRQLQRTGLTLLQFLRTDPLYQRTPILILTGIPLGDAEAALARRLRAEVFYKPQPYSALSDRLEALLATSAA